VQPLESLASYGRRSTSRYIIHASLRKNVLDPRTRPRAKGETARCACERYLERDLERDLERYLERYLERKAKTCLESAHATLRKRGKTRGALVSVTLYVAEHAYSSHEITAQVMTSPHNERTYMSECLESAYASYELVIIKYNLACFSCKHAPCLAAAMFVAIVSCVGLLSAQRLYTTIVT
jgi:hypothetical protein